MAEQEASSQGVIRREEMPFLSEYETACAFYDEEEYAYRYAIKSDECRFSEYVGLRAHVSGPVSDVGKKLAVVNVTHIQLSPDR